MNLFILPEYFGGEIVQDGVCRVLWGGNSARRDLPENLGWRSVLIVLAQSYNIAISPDDKFIFIEGRG